ncbi:MAG: hypothetical protein QNK05_19220 [Myxococcota bacterium]|nr:hypothetical protein [Myxococcota bacterium]
MQKLVTIFLSDDDDDDMEVQTHLDEYLDDGWTVKSLTPFGTGSAYGSGGESEEEGHCYVAGWLAILLEKG